MKEKKKLWWVLLLTFFVLAPVSCKKSELPRGEELATINNRVITLAEFNNEMEKLPTYLKPLMISTEARKEFLQSIIDRELLLQEGGKRGLDKDKRILETLDRLKKGLIIETLLEDLFKGKDEVSEKEIEEYYREDKKKFFVEEKVRVRHIVVKTLPEVKEIQKRLKMGDDFIKLAKQYSISPNREKGGDLGYIERGKVGKEFEKAAFSLKRQGEISDIVKTSSGYHIIRLEDRQEPHQRTFSEVKEEIRGFLKEKKRGEILAAYLKDLREKSQIVINEKLLSEEEEGK